MTSEQTPYEPTTGEIAAANIRRLRADQRFTYAALARELTAIGCPIPELGLRRLEQGKRRIDVDDLVAFARVFKVSPVDLLTAPGTQEAPDAPPAATVVHLSIDGKGATDQLLTDLIHRYVRRANGGA